MIKYLFFGTSILLAFFYRYKPRTVLIYTTHVDDVNQHERVAKLSEAFGSNLVVIWDNKEGLKCPFHNVLCVDNITISKTVQFDPLHGCCGAEKAIMWAISNRNTFERLWYIEEDVYYTDMSILKSIVNARYTEDLLTQRSSAILPQTKKFEENKIKSSEILKQWRKFDSKIVPKTNLLNMYSLNRRMLEALNDIYIKNNYTWIFAESLLPTAVEYYNLTSGVWKHHHASIFASFRRRPCFVFFKKSGIYHPAKHRRGEFIKCRY